MNTHLNPEQATVFTNWIDPDILAFNEGRNISCDIEKEREFKSFFDNDWHTPQFDTLRQRWGAYIESDNPHARVLAKTALWSVIQLKTAQNRALTMKEVEEGVKSCQI